MYMLASDLNDYERDSFGTPKMSPLPRNWFSMFMVGIVSILYILWFIISVVVSLPLIVAFFPLIVSQRGESTAPLQRAPLYTCPSPLKPPPAVGHHRGFSPNRVYTCRAIRLRRVHADCHVLRQNVEVPGAVQTTEKVEG